jgi:hypothetical protein
LPCRSPGSLPTLMTSRYFRLKDFYRVSSIKGPVQSKR